MDYIILLVHKLESVFAAGPVGSMDVAITLMPMACLSISKLTPKRGAVLRPRNQTDLEGFSVSRS